MKKIRIHLLLFAALLILSGVTAFPIQTEIGFLHHNKELFPPLMEEWIKTLYQAIDHTPQLMFYGTDWLAFAHIVIALFFIPVYIHPQRYQLNLRIAMAACLLIFPLAFIFGPIRGIPFFHQLIDCSFGLAGYLYLQFILRKINQLTPVTYEKNI
jgi:hypothetical protein